LAQAASRPAGFRLPLSEAASGESRSRAQRVKRWMSRSSGERFIEGFFSCCVRVDSRVVLGAVEIGVRRESAHPRDELPQGSRLI